MPVKVKHKPPKYARQRRKLWSKAAYRTAMTVEPPAALPEGDKCWDVCRAFFINTDIVIELKDGRRFARPLRMYHFLASATPAQRANYRILGISIYFPDVDEAVDIEEWRRAYIYRHL